MTSRARVSLHGRTRPSILTHSSSKHLTPGLRVHLGIATGLVFPTDNTSLLGVTRNLFLHARVQLLPIDNPEKLAPSLFALNPPAASPYRKFSQIHRECPCPVFQEDFEFNVAEVANFTDEFRLFVVLMASMPIAKDGKSSLSKEIAANPPT